MDLNHLVHPHWLALPIVRRSYAVAVVAIAVFCVGLSFTRLQSLRSVCEAPLRVVVPKTAGGTSQVNADLAIPSLQQWLTSKETLQATHDFAIVSRQQLQVFPDADDPDTLLVRVQHTDLPTANRLADFFTHRLAGEIATRHELACQTYRQRLLEDVHHAREIVAAVEQESQSLLFAMRNELANLEAEQQRAELSQARSILARQGTSPTTTTNPPVAAPQPTLNPSWVAMQAEVQALEAKLGELQIRYTADHPLLQVTQLQLNELRLRWQNIPQYLQASSEGPQPTEAGPALNRPEENWQQPGPVARFTNIKQTSAEVPTAAAAPIVQQYLTELAACSTQLATARQGADHAEAMLRDWDLHENDHTPTLHVGKVRVLEWERKLPRQNLLLMLGLGALSGSVIFIAGIKRDDRLKSGNQLSASLGMPLLSTVVGRGKIVTDYDENSADVPWERYVAGGAEFVLGAFVAAYVASYCFDPAFAQLVGQDPLAAIAEIWHR